MRTKQNKVRRSCWRVELRLVQRYIFPAKFVFTIYLDRKMAETSEAKPEKEESLSSPKEGEGEGDRGEKCSFLFFTFSYFF